MTTPAQPGDDPGPRAAAVPVGDVRPDDGDGVTGSVGSTAAEGPRTAPEHRGRLRHPWRLAAAVVILVGLVVLVGGALWVRSEADPSGPPGAQVIVTVPAGSGESATGSLLADKGVIGSSLAFRIWSQFNSLPGVQAGAYAFRENSSFGTVQAVLASGPERVPGGGAAGVHRVRAGRPGWGSSRGTTAAAFQRAATDGSVRSPWQPTGVTSLEGLLGPGHLRRGTRGDRPPPAGADGRPLRRPGRPPGSGIGGRRRWASPPTRW